MWLYLQINQKNVFYFDMPKPPMFLLDSYTLVKQKAQSSAIIRMHSVIIHFKDVVTPYTHISEASRYILYTIILTIDGICTLS